MLKRFGYILTALIMTLCLLLGNFAGVVAVADDGYMTISSKGGTLDSGKYILESDITIESKLRVTSGKEVTIDLNGYSISSISEETVIMINGGTLTLMDSSADGTGTVENKSTSTSTYGIKFLNGGTLYMNGGTVSGCYGIYSKNVSGNCEINITAGTIIGTKKSAVYFETGSNYSGTISISGSKDVMITSLSSSSDGYGIYCNARTALKISNPNTYISSSSASKSVYMTGSYKECISAGHYTSDVSNYLVSGYSCNKTDDSDYPYVVTADVVEPEVVLPKLHGEALTLDGSVGVTFYFNMTNVSSPEAYTMTAKIGEDGEEEIISAGQTKTLDDGIEYYRYTVYVNPDEYCTTIYASLTDGINTTETYGYSVYDYCIYSIENDCEESDLCKALLNYGDYACAYDSGVSTCSLGSFDDWTDPVKGEWTADLSEYSGTDTPGVAKTILLGSTIAIRLYLTPDVASESDVFTVGGEELKLYSVDDENYSYYVEFKVSAADMVKTFTVLKNGEEFTSYSVLAYVNNTIEFEDDDTALSNLCKAIYYYSVAASEYRGWN